MLNINDVNNKILLSREKRYHIIDGRPIFLNHIISIYIYKKYFIHFSIESIMYGDVGIWYEYQIESLDEYIHIDLEIDNWLVKNSGEYGDMREYFHNVGFFYVNNYIKFNKSSYIKNLETRD